MEVTKIVKWTLGDGRQAQAQIEVIRKMENNTAYADGWNVNLGKKPVEMMVIEVSDGKFIGRSYNDPSVVTERFFGKDYTAKVQKIGGYARLTDNVIIKESVYNEIMEAIEDATEEASQDAEYKAYAEAKNAAKEAARPVKEARAKELVETEIPETAMAAYNQYQGSDEAAWEDENEISWSLIRKWAPYIEAQHGIAPGKVREISKEIIRETNYGVQD